MVADRLLPDGATEDDTERDGVLSYAAEWHALLIGFGVGISGRPELVALFVAFVMGAGGERLRQTAHIKDAAKEGGYAFAGVALGLIVNALLLGGSTF